MIKLNLLTATIRPKTCRLPGPFCQHAFQPSRAMSELSPSSGKEDTVTTKYRSGLYAPYIYAEKELDLTKTHLANSPLYTASSSFHVAATKRTAWVFAMLGGYFSVAMLSMESIPLAISAILGIPSVVPLPFVLYYTTPYVNRIFRIYNSPEGVPIDTTKLDVNEEFLFECLSITGRSLYNCRVKLCDLRVVNKRNGWVTLEVVDSAAESRLRPQNAFERAFDGTRTRRWFYVADDIGGYKMERLWAIIDRQSGVDNGRD
ncbi:uncharacterized protein V1516DRAFT_674200 [Lipomyces oligophaga]|uniref:uncharacterized protein n=1 Tax=Lipomyces oligophaga TaxID=45792 RepID=UPI0034CDD0CA